MITKELVTRQYPHAVELRHHLHTIPEIAFEEFQTAKVIRQQLDSLGIQHIDGVENAPTATIGLIGDPSKPCIALRADIDALPILEQSTVDYRSTRPGMMHACGHDGHTSNLIGAAAILKQMEKDLNVCVKLIFQPAEEDGGGGEKLVQAGVLDGRIGPKVVAIFGLHGWPSIKVGTVATRAGALLAATSTFTATFIGRGCHGAYPHLGADPISAAAETVGSLQKIVSREFDPTDSAVITVGKIQGGTATNIIPDNALISGTVRGLNPDAMNKLKAAIHRRCEAIAAANECKVKIDWTWGYPATINDPAMADYVAKVAKQTLGETSFLPAGKPSMGGEDFSYYLQKVPGCFFLIGTCPVDQDSYPSLHNDRYNFTDEALKTGMAMFVELAGNFGKQEK